MEKQQTLKKIEQNYKKIEKLQRKTENLLSTIAILTNETNDLIDLLK